MEEKAVWIPQIAVLFTCFFNSINKKYMCVETDLEKISPT